jgi:hypothetical protein
MCEEIAENTELSSFKELKGEAMKKTEMAETTRKITSFALSLHCKKKFSDFPFPSREVTFPKFNYSRPGRVW